MKCPQCGFRNLPGTKLCGACGADLTVPTPTTLEPFFPPRAWGRRFRQPPIEVEQSRRRWRRWFPFRRPETTPTSTLQQISEQRRLRRLVWLTSLRSLVGLIPGVGLIMEKQNWEGWRLLSAFLVCIAVAVIFWRNFLSNIALLAIAGLILYSVGATFFASWRRNNLPNLSVLHRVGIWLIILSFFLWGPTLGLSILTRWYGLVIAPFTAVGDEVVQVGNFLLYSQMRRNLTNLKAGDYVVFNSSKASPISNDLFIYYPQGTVLGRLESFREGKGWVVSVPMWVDGQVFWVRGLVPEEAIMGKVIAILNPPSRRRWLP